MVKIPSPQVFVQGQGSTSADNLNTFVQVCDNAARLAAFPGLPNMLVILLGINTLNDGGQGVFFFVSGTGFVTDGYNVFVPTGVTTGAWVRLAAIASSLASLAAPITFSINGTEVGRFDVNGNLGIGTVPPAGTTFILDIARNLNQTDAVRITNPNSGNAAAAGFFAFNDVGSSGQLSQTSSTYAGVPAFFRPDCTMVVSNGAGGMTIGNRLANAPLSFITQNVEQARFTGTGNLVLQGIAPVAAYPSDLTCQFSGASLTAIVTNDTNAAAGIDNAMVFVRNGSSVGSIQTSLTATTFNTSSDQNLKTEDGVVVDSGALIDSVEPHSFTWNATGEQDFGFFAQELEAAIGDVAIHAVSVGSPTEEFGTPEYRNWGVDMSQLVPLLWAEIRSLRARVAQLEGAP